MTQIGTVIVDVPRTYRRNGYAVSMNIYVETEELFTQMRELFAKADYGTAIHSIPGERPYGEDLTAEGRNTQYVIFTSGTSGKVSNGWYLLRPSFAYVENDTPRGYTYVYDINLFFLGTDAYYQSCYSCVGLEVEESDWDI